MAITVAASGTQTATLDTDHTLTTTVAPTGGATYKLRIDTNALAGVERLTITIQTAVLSGGTNRTLWQASFVGAQPDPIKDFPYVEVIDGEDIVCVLRQEAGTGRAFPWSLMRVA